MPKKLKASSSSIDTLFDGLAFAVADGNDRVRALRTRYDVYAQDWPDIPPNKVVDEADTTAHQLIASTSGGAIIACLRIVTSNCRPFDMERYVSLDRIISSDRVPAEIGRLVVRHEYRCVKSNSFVQLGIFKLAVDLSQQLGITDLLLTALPTLRNLYRFAGFMETGVEFRHSTWGPVHVMRLDLTQLISGDRKHAEGLYRFLRSSPASRIPE